MWTDARGSYVRKSLTKVHEPAKIKPTEWWAKEVVTTQHAELLQLHNLHPKASMQNFSWEMRTQCGNMCVRKSADPHIFPHLPEAQQKKLTSIIGASMSPLQQRTSPDVEAPCVRSGSDKKPISSCLLELKQHLSRFILPIPTHALFKKCRELV